MRKIQPVVIGVIYDVTTDKFLLTLRNETGNEQSKFNNCWNFPGGGVQFGETLENAVIRELKEELCIDVIVEKPIPRVFSSVRKDWHGILICYICRMKSEDYNIILNEESDTFDWFTLEAIQKLHTLPLAFEIAQEAKKLL